MLDLLDRCWSAVFTAIQLTYNLDYIFSELIIFISCTFVIYLLFYILRKFWRK